METEEKTRKNRIDNKLAAARWDLKNKAQIVEEFEVITSTESSQFADYVLLGRDAKPIAVIEAKKTGVDPQALAGEFQNELLSQAWRQRIVEQNRQFVETITARALGGAAGAPGLDELLTMDIGEETAFDDPLGIAMSWEEKYKKKGKSGETKAEGEDATNSESSGGKAS